MPSFIPGPYDDKSQLQSGQQQFPGQFPSSPNNGSSSGGQMVSAGSSKRPAVIRPSNRVAGGPSLLDQIMSNRQQAMGKLDTLRAGGAEYSDWLEGMRMNPMNTFY